MRKYADDYELVVKEDEKGRLKKTAVYKGTYFEVVQDERTLKKFKRNSLLLLAITLIGFLLGGFINNQGMRMFYIAIPWAAAFLPLYFLAFGIIRLPVKKRKFRCDEIGLTFDRMKKASIALFILLSMVVVGEIIFLVGFAKEGLNLEYTYLVSQALTLIAVFIIIRLQDPIEVQASGE
jgi:MFS family permease